DRLRQRLDVLGRARVELHVLFRRKAFELGVVEVARDHLRALGDEQFGDGTADALAGRGDDGGLALQAVGHGQNPPKWVPSWPGIVVRRPASLRSPMSRPSTS